MTSEGNPTESNLMYQFKTSTRYALSYCQEVAKKPPALLLL